MPATDPTGGTAAAGIVRERTVMSDSETDGPAAAASGATDGVPAGFVPLPLHMGFVAVNGPLYARREGGHFITGFRVEARHTNPMGNCHGGMLMLFADMHLPLSAQAQVDLGDAFLPTINLATDFVAPAPLGAWVHGRADVIKVTRKMVFAQGIVYADGEPAARINGIFKRAGGAGRADGINFRELFLSWPP